MDRIEFHYSYLVAVDERTGAVNFEAYIHRGYGEGRQAEGGVQNVRFTFEGMIVQGELGRLPADLSDGELLIDGEKFCDLLPIPSDLRAAVQLTLVVKSDGRRITIAGSTLKVAAIGEYNFVELTEFGNA